MKLLKMILNGIAWGCTIATFIAIIGAAVAGDSFLAITANDFIGQAVGSMIVGIGFTVPSLIYDSKKLSMGMKTFIHMAIGFFIYFITALHLNWIPVEFGSGMIAVSVLTAASFAFGIWLLFYLYNRKEAKKLNQKLESMK